MTTSSISPYFSADYLFPLHLYLDNNELRDNSFIQKQLDDKLVQKFAIRLGLNFMPDLEGEGRVCFASSPGLRPEFRDSFGPGDLMKYSYAVLHSAKIQGPMETQQADFELIPITTNTESFWKLVQIGAELQQVHWLKHPALQNLTIGFLKSGSNMVTNPEFRPNLQPDKTLGRIYINPEQYFDAVTAEIWEFTLDNQKPAQKWLNDRLNIKLKPDDILYYQRMLAALAKTVELVSLVEKLIAEIETKD